MPSRINPCSAWLCGMLLFGSLACAAVAHAAERVTLRNGFAIACDHREALDAEHVRLYLDAGTSNYMDVPGNQIAGFEPIAAVPVKAAADSASRQTASADNSIDGMIRSAGEARSLNVDLLRSVVNAESGGHVHAVSRAGAQGLMQLMPGTARSLGVTDSFAPEQNLRGGTDYLDSLLHRYHDDLALALAAYNAGPAAVDKYRGVPPYRETRAYVARIIREFNRRSRSLAVVAGAEPVR